MSRHTIQVTAKKSGSEARDQQMNTKNQTQNVPSEGILEAGKVKLNSAINTAKQVAHTIGEKIAYQFNLADQKEESVKYVDPLATPKDLLLVKAHLKHTQTIDKSKPVIDKDAHILKNQHTALFAAIKQRHDLKHVSITHDASKPFLDKDMHIKEAPQKKIFAEIKQQHQLKHVKSNDRSAPVIPRDFHLAKPTTEALLEVGTKTFNSAISTAKQVAHTMQEKTQQVAHNLTGYNFSSADQKDFQFLTYVDTLANPKDLLLAKSQLKHTQTIDKSKPIIDKDVRINQNHHKALFAEIKQGHDLKHVTIDHDASLPSIDKKFHLKEAPQKKLFADIKLNKQLKHVTIAHDASKPFIERDIHIKETPSKKVLDAGKETVKTAFTTAKQVAHALGEKTQQVAHALEEKVGYKLTPSEPKEEFVKFVDPLASPRDLEEVKSHLKPAQTQDKSKPVIENDVHIKENHHKDLLVEIGQKHDLHHVKTSHDASKPIIDKDIHIKEAPQKKVLSDITQHHQLKHVKMNDKSAPVIPKDVHIIKKKRVLE